MEGLRGVTGRPHPELVLPPAGGGDVGVRCPPDPGPVSAEAPLRSTALPVPALRAAVGSLAVPAAVSARSLPQVPLPAAGGSRGLPGVERTLPGLVQSQTQLRLGRPGSSRGRTPRRQHGLWEAAGQRQMTDVAKSKGGWQV